MIKTTNDTAPPRLSVVIPLLDEQDNLRPLYEQLKQALQGSRDHEIIFVDDGSTDASFEVLRDLHRLDQKVRAIRFRRNFGQTAALSAGFARARGEVIIAMDADLQNDPADIPTLLGKLGEGYDVVSGWRRKRRDPVVTRLLPSRFANWLISGITGVRLHDYGCTLKAYRREVLSGTRLYGDMHRFIPALASWGGARIAEIEVSHRARAAGRTKYGLGRTLNVALDLITVKFLGSFSTKPIHVFGGIGLVSMLAGILSGLTVIFQKVAGGVDMTGNPLLILTAVLIITTVQFLLMGLLAELQVRAYQEALNRPAYAVKEVLESPDSHGVDP